jgi:hypothetical protein
MLKMPRGVRPALRFLPPARHPWLLAFAPLGSWLYVRLGNRVVREEMHGAEKLVRAYRQMRDGKARLIVAFRHPGVEDGTVVFRLMTGIVAREARRLGVPLPRPRGYFLYGRDVPDWAGQFLNWMLPLLGAISVFPGRYDSQSIAALRRCLTDMPHPIALAPEGQVTYHNEWVASLEAGTAQLGFWCLEDLRKRARTEEVLVVPVCTSYHYSQKDWKGLLRLLSRIEKESGAGQPESSAGSLRGARLPPDVETRGHIYSRVMRLSRHLVGLAESFYCRFYGISFPAHAKEETNEDLQGRLRGVCEAALRVAERFFRLQPKGDFVQRVLAARQAGLAWMFQKATEELPPVERAIADRIALESWLCNLHVNLVDVLEYIRADYLMPDSSFDRFVESITNLWDVVNRLKGGNISGRINPFAKIARIVINEPIPVSRYWDCYVKNRRTAVSALTGDIYESFRRVAENDNRPVSQ